MFDQLPPPMPLAAAKNSKANRKSEYVRCDHGIQSNCFLMITK